MLDAELDAMLANDESHWWYRGRRRVLRAELDRLHAPPGARLLDVGCGSGRTLDELAVYGLPSGVDLSDRAVRTARERGHLDVLRAPAEDLPFAEGAFDVVTCLDVLEHIDDDRAALRELLRVTRPGGRLVVTVPAYPALWSRHDEQNLHRRRYTRASLRAAARDAGWHLERETSFNTLLLPVAAAVRLAQRVVAPRPDRSDLARSPALLNRVLELPLALEASLLRLGLRLPAGMSLLAVLARSPY